MQARRGFQPAKMGEGVGPDRVARFIAFLWLFVLLFALYVLFDLHKERAKAEQQAGLLATSYVRLIEEHASSTFERTNLILTSAIALVSQADITQARSLPPARRQQLEAALAELQSRSPGMVAMSFADAEGYVYANSVGVPPGGDLGNRRYFLQLKQGQGDTPVISEAVKGRVSDKWGVQMARAIRDGDGRFAGMVVASVGISEYFLPFYQSLDGPAGTIIALRGLDHRLVVRFPMIETQLGAALPPDRATARIFEGGRREGLVVEPSPIDGAVHMVAVRKLRGYPLYSLVGFAESQYLAAWRESRNHTMLAILGTILVATCITLILRHRNDVYQLAANVYANSVEGIVVTDANATILSVNPAFCEITGYSAAEAVGRRPSILRSEHHDQAFFAALWHALKTAGRWQGEVWNRRKDGDVYIQSQTISAIRDRAGRIVRYVSVFTDITELRRNQEHVQHLAYHDVLTSLPNRLLLQDRLDRAIALAQRDHHHLAVVFLDLDHFKAINDSLGHDVGDGLLQAVADRLTGAVRAADTVARMGGDEFVLLLEQAGSAEDIGRTAQKILTALAVPIDLAGEALRITTSLGIATFPEDGQDALTLLKHADTAMYAAKAEGRATYRFFSAEMTEKAARRLRLERELRLAVEQGDFELHYQPKIRLADGSLCGVEALVRWRHPELGLVPPDSFIPLAEETGLIVPLGDWVIDEACRQAARWQEQGLFPIPIAVNVSSRQLFEGDFPERLATISRRHDVTPSQLQVEITESSVMADPERAAKTLEQLRGMGTTIALDDFGTGYSSLAYLSRLPIDVIKIDRSFLAYPPFTHTY